MYENSEVLFGGEKRLLELVSLIYGAVEQPSLWAFVLDGIAEAAGSGCTCLLADSESGSSLVAMARTDPTYLASYAQHYASVNVVSDICDRMFADGTVRYSHLALPDAAFAKTEIYNDFFRAEDYFYSFGIKIPLPDRKPAYLASLRPKQSGPYRPEEGALLTTLLPHLQRALRLHMQLSLVHSGLQVAFDCLSHGLIMLDTNGRCVLMNGVAQEILNKRDGLLLLRSKPVAECTHESTRLRTIIDKAVKLGTSRIPSGNDAMLVSRKNGKPLHVVVDPYISGMQNASPGVAAMVAVYDPEREAATPIEVFQSLYGLTKAEAKLACLLGKGRDISEAAELNRVTRETIRSQLKSIFQKTGTHRQAELIRLLAALPARSC